jgi:hypothetical protein
MAMHQRLDYLRNIVSECRELELLDISQTMLFHPSGTMKEFGCAEDVHKFFAQIGIALSKLQIDGCRVWEFSSDLGHRPSLALIHACHEGDDPLEYILTKFQEFWTAASGKRQQILAVFKTSVVEKVQSLPQSAISVPWSLLKALIYLICFCIDMKEDVNDLFVKFVKLAPHCDLPQEQLLQEIFESEKGTNKIWILKDWIKLVLQHGKAVLPEFILDNTLVLLTQNNFQATYMRAPDLWGAIFSHPLFASRLKHRNGTIEESQLLSAVRIFTSDYLNLTWQDVIPILRRAKSLNALCYSGCISNVGILFMTSLSDDAVEVVEAKLNLVSRFSDFFSKDGEKILIKLCYESTKSFRDLIRLYNAWYENFRDLSSPNFLAQQLWKSMSEYNGNDDESQYQRFLCTLEFTADYPQSLPKAFGFPLLQKYHDVVYYRVMRHLESPSCSLPSKARDSARMHACSLLGFPLAAQQQISPLTEVKMLVESNEAWTFKEVSAILKKYANHPMERDFYRAVGADGRTTIDLLFSGGRANPFEMASWGRHISEDMPDARDVFDVLLWSGCWKSSSIHLSSYAFLAGTRCCFSHINRPLSDLLNSGSSPFVLEAIFLRCRHMGDEVEMNDFESLWMAYLLVPRTRRFGSLECFYKQLAFIRSYSAIDITKFHNFLSQIKTLEPLILNRELFRPWVSAFVAPLARYPNAIEDFLIVLLGHSDWKYALNTPAGREFLSVIIQVEIPDRAVIRTWPMPLLPFLEDGHIAGQLMDVSALPGLEELSPDEVRWDQLFSRQNFAPLQQNIAGLTRIIQRMKNEVPTSSTELVLLLEQVLSSAMKNCLK